jgi:hypothetical protein
VAVGNLVPTVLRGNAVLDALRRSGSALMRGSEPRTHSVRVGIPTEDRGNEFKAAGNDEGLRLDQRPVIAE